MARQFSFAAIVVSGFCCAPVLADTRVIPDDFPQKGEDWAEPSPKPTSRGPVASYPLVAETLKITGSTTVIFWIDRKGNVTRPLISSSAPSGFFEASCLDYVRTFKYAPQHEVDDDDAKTRRWSYTCHFKLE